MPNIKSAKKRLRQSESRRVRNKSVRSRIRTRIRALLATTSAEEAQAMLPDLYALIDRAAGRGVLHANTAARQKSRLARHVESLSD
ncbi:MAG: 30S ribosomal protein S20 [Candidatus Palauibacterales bacterium]|nr:30S ribosomal protein S20 [Candidatus Palauibacterales bacterium]MDP2528374.1 30S ribosomal protein S20 [Candidatus Palauibacterales bacterium]MDP2583770.1 30S ribosomal protein S20 [Candidatus Palauibacterales bacterium]